MARYGRTRMSLKNIELRDQPAYPLTEATRYLKLPTAAIAERIDAKETVEDLAADYGVTTTEIEQAVLFERAA